MLEYDKSRQSLPLGVGCVLVDEGTYQIIEPRLEVYNEPCQEMCTIQQDIHAIQQDICTIQQDIYTVQQDIS